MALKKDSNSLGSDQEKSQNVDSSLCSGVLSFELADRASCNAIINYFQQMVMDILILTWKIISL